MGRDGMARKVERQTIVRTPMEQTLTFELELTFPAEVKAEARTLMETVRDAIRDYDSRRRLLPGHPRPRGGDRLTGILISLTKTRNEVDRFGIHARLALADPPERAKTESTRDAIIDVSTQIDDRIEELREAQAHLWRIFDTLWKAESARSVTSAEQKAARVMASAAELLTSKRRKNDRSRLRTLAAKLSPP